MNEETQLLKDTTAAPQQQPKPAFTPAPAKKISGATVAAGAGGFVAGAAVGAAAIGATASTPASEEELAVIAEETPQDTENTEATETATAETTPAETTPAETTPAETETVITESAAAESTPASTISAPSEIKVAHVTADNFNDAFAQARAQVGPGGVFEYNGNLYGTYMEDEWNEMSAADRSEYYAKVAEAHPDYAPHSTPSTHSSGSYAHATHTSAPAEATVAADAEMLAVEPVDNGIRVLGVQTVANDDGQIMNVALVEQQGDAALLVDVDNDGTIEVLIHDDNGNQNIEPNELYDITEAGIQVDDLHMASMMQNDEINVVDDTPDYMSDADFTMEV